MSYILDALKKLEHEKNKKSRGNGMVNISGVLFETERVKATGSTGLKLALVAMVTVLLTLSVTWFLFRPDWTFQKSTSQHATISSPATIAPPVKIETAATPPAQPTVPAEPTVPVVRPMPATMSVIKPSVPSSKPIMPVVPSVTVEDAAALLTMQELRKRTKERKGPQTLAADQFVPAPADIKLSGIAWQEERKARRAVVNGFLMQEGGVVSGARITDIYQERVRFSLSGKMFEIPLVSSGVSSTR